MLTDFLSQDNFNQFNIGLARKIGLENAVYMNELLKINAKAIRKNKVKKITDYSTNEAEECMFFQVDRNYIEEQTTLTPEKQMLLDKVLVDLHIISKDSADMLCIHTRYLIDMFATENEKAVKTIIQAVKPKSASKDKKAEIVERLKLSIKTTDTEIYELYSNWIEAVCENPKAGYLSSAQAKQFKATIEAFANGNRDALIGILKTAISTGYKVPDWVLNSYKRNNNIADSVTALSAPAATPTKASAVENPTSNATNNNDWNNLVATF